MKAFNELKIGSVLAFAAATLLVGSIAGAAPGKSCKNFAGAWEGTCLKPDGKTENVAFTIDQTACESVAFNGEAFPMNEASMQASSVQAGDGKTVTFISETYPYWSQFGSILNVERHLVTAEEGRKKISHEVKVKESYQIGQGGKLLKEMSVNGQSVACALSSKQ